MKKLIIGCLLLLPLAGMAQHAFTVKGKIGKLNSPAKARLSYTGEDGRPVEDSCVLTDGVFTFKGTTAEPVIGRLYLSHTGENPTRAKAADFITILLDGTAGITAKDSLKNATIKGTPANMDYVAVMKKKGASSASVSKMWFDYQATPTDKRNATAFGEAYGKVMAADRVERTNIDITYATRHPASYLSPMLLVWHASEVQIDTLEMIYNAFTKTVKATKAAEAIAKKMDSRKAIEVGGKAPAFTIPDTAGNPVSLSSYKGKYVLVDFWASWCKPCRAENPNVNKAFDTYKDKNFTIISISIDDSSGKDKWLKAIADDHLDRWANVSELKGGGASAISSLYRIASIPQNVLIDPNGVIIAKNLRGEALLEKLASVLH